MEVCGGCTRICESLHKLVGSRITRLEVFQQDMGCSISVVFITSEPCRTRAPPKWHDTSVMRLGHGSHG